MGWYTFRQNNSGGRFDGPLYLSVEAGSAADAETLATEHGVYFDGVEAGVDCGCCGDRWSRRPEFGESEPMYYESPVRGQKSFFCYDASPTLRMVAADGTVTDWTAP